MPLFRAVMLLLLVAAAVSFVLYAVTGETSWRRIGLRVLLAALAAGFVCFGVLILERLF